MDIKKQLLRFEDLIIRREYSLQKRGQSYVEDIGYNKLIEDIRNNILDYIESLEEDAKKHRDLQEW